MKVKVSGDAATRANAITISPARMALACGVLLLLVFTATLAFPLLSAAYLIYGMSQTRPPLIVRAYPRMFQHTTVTTDFAIQGRNGPLQIRLLTPRGLPNAPMMVVVHGFAPNGNQDDLLNAIATRLCRSGLRVVMPNITSESRLRMSVTAIDDIDDTVRWSARTSGQKVSLFGISFSGGPVISAAAVPDYADSVKMVFCISGFNSIDRLGRYYLHDAVKGPDQQPYAGIPPPNALTPMALQYLDELVPAGQVQAFVIPLRAILAGTPPEVAADNARLTSNQRNLLEDLLTVRTDATRERYHALLVRHRAELAAISPMGKIDKVHGTLYILHGVADTTIPKGEAQWTGEEASTHRNVKVLITPWIHHAVLEPSASYWAKLRAGYFVSQMLQTALQPVPLSASR